MEFNSPTRATEDALRAPVRTADLLVDILADAGVEVVFGLPGGPISPLHDALMDRPDIRVVTTRHESGAMFAAAGFAQTSGRLGVALVTSGPGVLNAMTGLASAFCDGLPVLLLAGEVPRKVFGKGALQDGSSYHLNIVQITSHISKMSAETNEPNAAPALLRRAIATALSGRRGPVVLTLPMDVTTAAIEAPEIAHEVGTSCAVSPRTIERAAQLIGDGRRAAIFAGSGVRGGEGPARLLQLAEKLQCPVFTTPKGKGVFPEDHPLSIGVFGIGGHPSVVEHLGRGLDVLLAIGTGLGEIATNGWSDLLKPERAFIHVDIDATQIGRAFPTTLGIAAPAHQLCALLAQRLPQAPARDAGGIRYFTDPSVLLEGAEQRIAPQRAMWEMQRMLPANTIYTCDSGEHFLFATHYLRTTSPDGHIAMSGLGSMGSSIGAAIGAQLARPDRTVAAICGDGCFAMNAFEVATAVAQELPIIIFVINDARLGMVEIGHSAVYGRSPTYSTNPMDVAALARSLGADSLVVERAGDILTAPRLRVRGRPLVVDVRIDRTIKMPKKDRLEAFASSPALRLLN